jgi:hypothetical protein
MRAYDIIGHGLGGLRVKPAMTYDEGIAGQARNDVYQRRVPMIVCLMGRSRLC